MCYYMEWPATTGTTGRSSWKNPKRLLPAPRRCGRSFTWNSRKSSHSRWGRRPTSLTSPKRTGMTNVPRALIKPLVQAGTPIRLLSIATRLFSRISLWRLRGPLPRHSTTQTSPRGCEGLGRQPSLPVQPGYVRAGRSRNRMGQGYVPANSRSVGSCETHLSQSGPPLH